MAVNSFRLTVQPAGNPTSLQMRRVNNLPASSRIFYRPLDLPADMKRDAKLTLVLVPTDPDGAVTVLEPRLAAAAGEWVTPFAARLVLLVFAPQGLDEKRVTNLVTKDEALVQTLADYADATSDLEAQLEAGTRAGGGVAGRRPPRATHHSGRAGSLLADPNSQPFGLQLRSAVCGPSRRSRRPHCTGRGNVPG